MASKPRQRIRAGSTKDAATNDSAKSFTSDNFQNFAASLGYGASNMSSGSSYGFNPITRNHTQLEWMYRGSWLIKVIVDAVAEDMTRERINVESDMPPDQIDKLDAYMERLMIWQRLTETLKWARLYGGCLAVVMIDGQKIDTPLRLDTVGKGQFKGLLVLDRWMVWPHLDDPIKELGKDYGMPKYYEVVSDARVVPHLKIHHTRCIRFEGVELPYWQKMAENYWGLSVVEPMFDRLIAFDSTTQGAAQLVYKAHLRVVYIEKLRELIAFGGPAFQAVAEQIKQIRLYQSNEGITLLDASDKFEANQYQFGGLSDLLIQFAQQLSGAAQIPLVRLFGQSPAGLAATGDADIRNYYDFINSLQESRLRQPVSMLLELSYRSLTGGPLPEGFDFTFAPLWQLADTEKAGIAAQITQSVAAAFQAGILTSGATALKELRQSSKVTGVWSNITDEDIKDAESMPPPMMGEQGGEGEQPPAPGQGAAAGSGSPKQGADKPEGGEADDAVVQARLRRANTILGLLPEHAKRGHPSGIDKPEHLGGKYGHLHPIHEVHKRFSGLAAKHDIKQFVAAHTGDQLPMIEVHGIPVVIETPKGERRGGNTNWPNLTAHYGYFQATSSHEGNHEQMDCFVGDDPESTAVWLIEQKDPTTGAFDEYKFMVQFPDRDSAMQAYRKSYDNAEQRIGAVRRMNITALKDFLEEWKPGSAKSLNGDARRE